LPRTGDGAKLTASEFDVVGNYSTSGGSTVTATPAERAASSAAPGIELFPLDHIETSVASAATPIATGNDKVP
jgi:hypothetical protein